VAFFASSLPRLGLLPLFVAGHLILAPGLFSSTWEGWKNSTLHGSPEPPLPFSVEPVFQEIPWQGPIYIIKEPTTDHLIVIQQKTDQNPNLLRRVKNEPDAKSAPPIFSSTEWMVYGMTFDPDFQNNEYVYLFQHGPTGHLPRGNRISRYQYTLEPTPQIDQSSEHIIIEWRSAGHDGGDLAFGPDGMLYITAGDGTSDSDGWVSGQSLENLLGSILRIDVRQSTKKEPYQIPQGNPFLNEPKAKSEIWAYGLRNPWRMGIDAESGQIWVGNNGQDLWETAHLVRRSDNYGWSVFEGSHPFYPNRALGPTPHTPPTIEHSHSEFRSLTGGVVYRGEKWPELDGSYVYGDYATGRIWEAKHDGRKMLLHRELADTSLSIASFRNDGNGELLIVDHAGNSIYRLVRREAQTSDIPFPKALSQTGLFQFLSTSPHTPVEGVLPYSVNASAWNDGAVATRWMAVPSPREVNYSNTSSWSFPDGTALVETLSIRQKGKELKPLETRILLQQQKEWAGYSYQWNEDASDATLVPSEGKTIKLKTSDGALQTWRFPSRTECAVCHSRAANFALGISGIQLNRHHLAQSTNQLTHLASIGLFKNNPPEPLPTPLSDPYNSSTSLESRVRAYLHTNCAACHVEAGGGNAQIVLRQDSKLEDTGLIETRPQHATFGLPNAKLIAAGSPEQSVLLHRISQRGIHSGQMPPLVSTQVDQEALKMFREWIQNIPGKQESINEWVIDDFKSELPSLENGRNYLKGKALFSSTGCIQCHRFGEEGGSVGPDLTNVSDRLTPHQLRESLIEPSRSIDPKYVIPESIPPLSTMPRGMVDSLTKDQILNLLYYLKRNGRPRVAAIVTEYRHNSHADVIVSRLLQTDTLDGKGKNSPLELVSLYTDQQPENDTSRMLAASHRFNIYSSIRNALTLGTDQVSVDGVLLIAEHGDYPLSPTGNRMYPKRRFWNEIIDVLEENSSSIPIFIDKHLADNWEDAEFIFSSAAHQKIPLMAGSSLPTTWRQPPADVARGASLSALVAITYHTTDAYGFHALEFIQALVEQRKNGETGIASVQSVLGQDVWAAIDSNQVPRDLFNAAWARLTLPNDKNHPNRTLVKKPRLFTIEYRDGLHVYLFELNGAASEWSAAWKYQDTEKPIESSLFWTQEGRPAMHFTWLLNGIEQMFLTGTPSWNAKRTLLTSGTLDALLQSVHSGGQVVNTPHLKISYQPKWRWTEPSSPPEKRPWDEQ
jgi:uncharacterized repeat protein (TIGR03806 family)